MPRIHDARNDSPIVLGLRAIAFVVATVVACVLFSRAGHMVGDPKSAIARYHEPAVMPHVFVKGTIHRRSGESELPAHCSIDHERYGSCGKSQCWKYYEGFRYSNARIEILGSSGPLPSSMNLSAKFHYEPWSPAQSSTDDSRALAWRKYAQANGLGFSDAGFNKYNDRIVESCLQENEQVYLEACVSPSQPGMLEPCPGQDIYGVIPEGENGQPAIDDAADDIARYIAGAAAALFVAALAWLRARRPIMGGLEDRAAPHRKKLGIIWGLLAIPPVLGISVVLMHASRPPSSWASGRGGFAFALSVLVAWLFFALTRWLHRKRTLAALEPVLATPRSLLADASGTVELSVRAKGNELRSFIGDEPIAFTELVINETFRAGRNTSTQQVYRGRPSDRLQVIDESSEGVLDLSNSILDVELRTITMNALSPRYLERGVSIGMHPNHVSYTIKEWVIRDGDPLYVFGDVSGIALQASEGGYRTVRGSPTLGGKDAAPVLVHAGDERGLIALLAREARAANSYAVVAACVCSAIGITLAALAFL